MGVVEGSKAADVSQLLNTTGVDLVLTDTLSSKTAGSFMCLLFVFIWSQLKCGIYIPNYNYTTHSVAMCADCFSESLQVRSASRP